MVKLHLMETGQKYYRFIDFNVAFVTNIIWITVCKTHMVNIDCNNTVTQY